jgi:hypothetical protein
MRKNIYRFLPVVLLGILFLSACNAVDDKCISPDTAFSYPAKHNLSSVNNILPPKPWQYVIDRPIPPVVVRYRGEIMLINSQENHLEIWTRTLLMGDSQGYSPDFLVYNIGTRRWREIPNAIKDNSNVAVLNVYQSQDGSLWGVNYWESDDNSGRVYPRISKFNNLVEKFELVEQSKGIPVNSYSLIDSDSVFWFLVPNQGIYSYNLSTHKLIQHNPLPDEYIESASLNSQGQISFIVRNADSFGRTYWNLKQFDSETNSVKIIELTFSGLESPYINLSSVLDDQSGRIWLGALVWREPGGDWYRLHPSPIFVVKSTESSMSFWQNPEIILESSDGRLWFRSENGMAWLNPDRGEWCWFTTYQSNIVEDADHNLWMIADGKLYKYPLQP